MAASNVVVKNQQKSVEWKLNRNCFFGLLIVTTSNFKL